jgi:AcrR family transcriptional regulator
LATSCALIIREGYAAFSLRQVAEAVGIKLATLQYYYPTREALLTATVKRSLKGWRRGFSEIVADASFAPRERLRALLRRNLDYIVDEPETVLLFDVFAMARREDFIRATIERAYLDYRLMFVELFAEIEPAIGKADGMAIATIVTSHMEGLMVFGAPDDPVRSDLGALRRAVDAFADGILQQVRQAGQAACRGSA